MEVTPVLTHHGPPRLVVHPLIIHAGRVGGKENGGLLISATKAIGGELRSRSCGTASSSTRAVREFTVPFIYERQQ